MAKTVPSLQAKHSRRCALGGVWTPFERALDGCTCIHGPLYFAVIRIGSATHREAVGRDRDQAQLASRRIASSATTDSQATGQDAGFADWADRWLASLERKPTTIASYRSTIDHAKDAFGYRHVRRIGAEDIARFNGILLGNGCSASTRAKHLRVLGACLQAAIYYRLADSNPVRELPPAQRPRPERKEAAYFENEELPRLFEQLTEEPYRTLCLAALKTGMRQGELIALRWGDVDLEQATIRVRRSYTGGHLGTPKNRERRDVDLISDVVTLLTHWNAGASDVASESLVFPSANTGFLSPTLLLKKQLYPAMRAAGIERTGPTLEKRTFHSFRHTFAKRALERGAQITWLSRHLGHSTLKVTTDIYGHWERAERRLQAAKMEGAFPV